VHPNPALLRLAPALQLSLRGSSCIYQGDELGLPEAEIAFEDLQDPYGIAMWPEFKGRDGCRTPMPWDSAAPDLGFGSGAARPWLPLAESHRALAVDRQHADPESLLQHYRRLLHWRKGQPALIHGEIELLPEHAQVLAFVRSHRGERILCAFNLSEHAAAFELRPGDTLVQQLDDSGASGAVVAGAGLRFDPFGVLFARLA
jgi:alpha-glucosidase